MTQDYFKSKITFLNVILTIMIVILHAKSPERFGLLLEDYPVIYSISMLCRVATPLFFFFISASVL
jgi:surface polysaccharide O-acyltransferase-like enzyme